MITGIVPRDLDRGERIVALIPVSGRAVAVSLVAPLVPLSIGVFLTLHRRNLFDIGVAHFASLHTFVAGVIAGRTGLGLELAGIAAYAATGVLLLAVFAFLGRWAAAAVVANAVELVVRPFKLVPHYLFTARAVTTKSYITKSGIFRSVPTKTRLERIKNRVPRLRGRIGELLNYGDVVIITEDQHITIGWVTRPREVCEAFNAAAGSRSFTAEPEEDLGIIEGHAVAVRPPPVQSPARPLSREARGLEANADMLVRMLIEDPDHIAAWSLLSEAYAALGRPDQARKARRVHQALNRERLGA